MKHVWLLGILLLGCSEPPQVATTAVARGDLVDSFREEAETRFRKTHLVSMPAAGRIARIDLEPGDRVSRGQILARFDRLPSQSEVEERQAELVQLEEELRLFQDTSVESAEVLRQQSLVQESSKRLRETRAHIGQARAREEQARRELVRSRALMEQGALPKRELEQAELSWREARLQVQQLQAQLQSQQALVQANQRSVAVAHSQVDRRLNNQQVVQARWEQARARLERARHEAGQTSVTSPIDGVVVERHQQGPAPLPAGEKLLTLAEPQDLEAQCEVLTQDALRLRPGVPVRLHPGPDRPAFDGKVSRVEPRGFTKLSSLGVEQKRVRVLIQIPQRPQGLGADYRLDAEFILGRRSQALTLPRSSLLQKPDGSYFVYVLTAGHLRARPVKLGVAEDLRVEVLEGLKEGEQVVTSPESTMSDGQEARQEPDRKPP